MKYQIFDFVFKMTTTIHNLIGAIDKKSGDYVLPTHASKECEYKCPDCKNDLIFKKGKVIY